MSHMQYVESLVKEFMAFRGVSNSGKAVDVEFRSEDVGLRADKIIDQISQYINNHELQNLRDLWLFLEDNLFNKLDHALFNAVKKLEHSVLKLYLVTAYVNSKHDKVMEFFLKLSPELCQNADWKDWSYFPFCKNPEDLYMFSMYFTRLWQDTVLISLHNFLSTIYQCMPQPALSKLELELMLLKRLHEENSTLKAYISDLLAMQSSSTNNISNAASDPSRKNRFLSQKSVQSLNDILPANIPPPNHIIDDFYIIAAESIQLNQTIDSQSRGIKYLIKNISSTGSPILGKKESAEKSKRRSESVGRNWI